MQVFSPQRRQLLLSSSPNTSIALAKRAISFPFVVTCQQEAAANGGLSQDDARPPAEDISARSI
jgi:hypothetical protein